MRSESVIFAIAGAVFGLLVGWLLGARNASTQAAVPPPSAAAPAQAGVGETRTAAPLDENRASELKKQADQRPGDGRVRVELANLYFDAERYGDAVPWYEAALERDPRNPDVSTDLGISYYYTNQTDRALAQFARSLSMNPRHTKTLFNLGIVRAFGKQDLPGAAEAWQQVLAISPDSPEGRAARTALEGLRTAHPEIGSRTGS
jgi:cytochrome c-type biogenesis protein CcmH/NrfG